MIKNIFQQQVTPEKPKVLAEERIYVYLPTAGENKKGIASFKSKDFVAPNGEVSLRWPMDMMVQQLANPTARPSLIKVLPDEFVNTNIVTKLIHPITGIEYSSALAEVKLNRENRNALAKPDLVMLSSEFEAQPVVGPNNEQYNSYRIKRQNPLTTPTIIQVDDKDFIRQTDIVKVSWPYAHDASTINGRTNGFGLVKILPGLTSNLKYNETNSLEVDLDAVKTNLAQYLATRPTYGEANLLNWPDRGLFVDPVTGLAKRDVNGNILLSLTKQAIGLSNLENKNFNARTYGEFGQSMKDHFEAEFGLKLNKDLWDGPAGLFRDWAPASNDRNTVQKWLARLETEDESLWSSIRSLKLFLGFYADITELQSIHPAAEDLLGSSAFLNSTSTYWAIRLNVATWEWFDTTLTSLDFYQFLETDAGSLQPNAPIANVSVGTSGKWIQSDHVHPSDPSKMDVRPIEDAIIQITSVAPNAYDFQVKVATTKVVDSEGTEIVASIVETVAYLTSIVDPVLNDVAIVRNTRQLYSFNGTNWIATSELGNIVHDTNQQVNIPYVRTTKFLHNWKNNPTTFTQDTSSNEMYWAGSEDEFEALNPEFLQPGALVVVEDGEYLEPNELVTYDRIDEAGLTLSDELTLSTEQFVTVEKLDALYGVPVTVTVEAAVPGVKGERRKLEALSFGVEITENDPNNRMAIVIPTANGESLGKRIFTGNRLMGTDAFGNLETLLVRPDNVVATTLSEENSDLESGQLVIASGTKTIQTFSSGLVTGRPVVSDGAGGITIKTLASSRLVKSDVDGAIDTVTWIEGNLIKSDAGINQVTLDTDRLVISGEANTIKTWASGGVDGSLVVRGVNPGQVKVRAHSATNRVIATAVDGTIQELPAGEVGQMLVSNGASTPGWVNAPVAYSHLPQTRLTTNPTEEEANAFSGLVAVVLAAPISVDQMRNNCIYYY